MSGWAEVKCYVGRCYCWGSYPPGQTCCVCAGDVQLVKHAPCILSIHAMWALLSTGYAETSLIWALDAHVGHDVHCRPSLKVKKALRGSKACHQIK
eukprot:1159205-Pelagomonas_calceolata.AAC.3